MDPFAPPSSTSEAPPPNEGAPPLSLPFALGAMALLLVVSGLVSILAPVRPPMWAAALCAPFVLALVIPRAPNALALPALCGLPMLLLSVRMEGPQMAEMNMVMNQVGWTLLVDTFVTLPALYVLARGPVDQPKRVLQYVLLVGAIDQLVAIGAQLVIPGALLAMLTLLLPYTAAVQPSAVQALKDALLHIAKAPLVWVVSAVGALVAWAAALGMGMLLSGGDVAWLSDPFALPFEARAATEGVEHLLRGVTTAIGATLYHRAIS